MTLERDRAAAGGLVVFLLVFWLGFIVHASPRFPGSLAGGVLAVSGATLIVIPTLVYAVVKRNGGIKARVTARVPMKRLLAWHVYTSLAGALLVVAHTAHKFDSPLGIGLTTAMLLAVLSGYVGRYFLGYIAVGKREKQSWLSDLRLAREAEMRREPSVESPGLPSRRELTAAMVEVEYAIAAHDLLRGRAGIWLRAHLVVAIAFYGLMLLHVAAAVYFGVRWW